MKRRYKRKSEKFTKAFSYQGAGGSHRDRVYTEGGGASAIAEASLLFDTPLGKREKEPRISFLEHYIHHKALSGDRKALREALYEYLRLSGVLCSMHL